MGFFSPKLPPFDVHFWYWGRRSERLKPMVQHWGEHGFGAPWGVVLVYTLKVAAYLAGGLAIIASTPGIGATPGLGSLAEITTWWTDAVVYQKAVIWSLLFEVVGLGCGFGPLTLRFLPPFGGILHWLRPNTIRLPPWPGRVPLTKGTRRTPVDVLLYLALLAALVWPLASAATQLDLGLTGQVAMLDPVHLAPFAVLLPLLGLRDKTIFLAARAEFYWLIALAFFMPFLDMVITIKILVVVIWWGAAASKLNKMFPFTVAAMFSNAPLPPKFVRRWMFRSFPKDMRPSRSIGMVARFGILVEFGAPLVLLISTDPWVTLGAVAVMVLFHLNIILALPLGAPLEWNFFIIFSTCYLFVGHFTDSLGTSVHPLAPALLAIPTVAVITWGNLRPDHVSFLLSMRYYAGNWATSMWAVRPSAITKINKHVVKSAKFPKQQLKRLYGEQVAEVVAHKVYTWRALHHHGRGLFGLLPRAAGSKHERAIVLDGELVAGTVLGWDFAEGHLHNEQLIAALQERCNFLPGEVRAVVLEAAPFGSDRQEYRLVDAAIGTFERGYVRVKDMLDRQPWEIDDLPVYVLRRLIDVPGDELDTDTGPNPVLTSAPSAAGASNTASAAAFGTEATASGVFAPVAGPDETASDEANRSGTGGDPAPTGGTAEAAEGQTPADGRFDGAVDAPYQVSYYVPEQANGQSTEDTTLSWGHDADGIGADGTGADDIGPQAFQPLGSAPNKSTGYPAPEYQAIDFGLSYGEDEPQAPEPEERRTETSRAESQAGGLDSGGLDSEELRSGERQPLAPDSAGHGQPLLAASEPSEPTSTQPDLEHPDAEPHGAEPKVTLAEPALVDTTATGEDEHNPSVPRLPEPKNHAEQSLPIRHVGTA